MPITTVRPGDFASAAPLDIAYEPARRELLCTLDRMTGDLEGSLDTPIEGFASLGDGCNLGLDTGHGGEISFGHSSILM